MNVLNPIIKTILTILLVFWVVLPIYNGSLNDGILMEISRLGILPIIFIVVAFFMMVAFYCRTLKKCYLLIKKENRKANPDSVWRMFILPFNFIEDFFIVIDLANSIEAEKRTNLKLNNITDFGMVTGIGWSIAQIMSFIPGIVGQMAGFVGMVLVICHWIQISRIKKLLQS